MEKRQTTSRGAHLSEASLLLLGCLSLPGVLHGRTNVVLLQPADRAEREPSIKVMRDGPRVAVRASKQEKDTGAGEAVVQHSIARRLGGSLDF